jgi:hypothetical protein
MALQALQNGVQDYLVEGQGDGDLIIARDPVRHRAHTRRGVPGVHIPVRPPHWPRRPRPVPNQAPPGARVADRDGTLATLLLMDLDRVKADPRGLLRE